MTHSPIGTIRPVSSVGGAIYYNPVAYVHEPAWTSAINGSREVKLKDLVDFIHGKDAT